MNDAVSETGDDIRRRLDETTEEEDDASSAADENAASKNESIVRTRPTMCGSSCSVATNCRGGENGDSQEKES
jgi:hypothetical protein